MALPVSVRVLLSASALASTRMASSVPVPASPIEMPLLPVVMLLLDPLASAADPLQPGDRLAVGRNLEARARFGVAVAQQRQRQQRR